jgi:hypothetical protein
MYKFAAQNKLRFPSVRGDLTVEQLFDLPLQSKSNFDLDSVARTINNSLKEIGDESFVENNSNDPRKKILESSLELVKDVIKTKQEENSTRLNKIRKSEERKKILDVMAAKKEQQLSQASLEELEAKLAALD